MKPHLLFGLALRILGLVFLYHGLNGLPSLLPVLFGAFMSMNPAGLAVSLFSVVWPFAVAWWLLGGAPWVARRAYPDSSD
jgi:hypothetical protein